MVARVHIRPSEATTKPLDAPNVRLPLPGYTIQVQEALYDVVYPLAKMKPQWLFVGLGENERSNAHISTLSKTLTVADFDVFEDGELLGNISIRYIRNSHKIYVCNDRLRAARHRSSGYATMDPDKAIKQVRKTFYSRTNSEMVEKAYNTADSILNDIYYNKQREFASRESVLYKEASAFARANFEMYLAMFPTKEKAAKEFEETTTEYLAIKDVRAAYTKSDGAHMICVRKDGTYLVVGGRDDTPIVFTNDTLPENIKSKLGMLKLVDAGTVISTSGVRIDGNTFIVLP